MAMTHLKLACLALVVFLGACGGSGGGGVHHHGRNRRHHRHPHAGRPIALLGWRALGWYLVKR
jgi:hypothetical protein